MKENDQKGVEKIDGGVREADFFFFFFLNLGPSKVLNVRTRRFDFVVLFRAKLEMVSQFRSGISER